MDERGDTAGNKGVEVRLGIHQPMYLPWLGLFDRIYQCDQFILLDNVAYSKNYFLNRNKIKTAQGWIWLTIPVLTKHNFQQLIKDTMVNNNSDWRKKHWTSIYYSYKNAPYFEEHKNFIETFYEHEWKYLVDASTSMLAYLLSALKIKTEITLASSLGAQGQKEELLLNICKLCGADEYLSGPDGRSYLNLELWQQNSIRVLFHDYQHPTYPQLYGEFISHLSVVDLLFNCGPQSLKILTHATAPEGAV
jgi:WbqC-like protein family